MWARSNLLSGFLASVVAVCLVGRAVAELLTALFPDGVPAYDMGDGVTVETRIHPEQMPLGLRAGTYVFMPGLDEGFGYNSNAAPGAHRRGSWEVVTDPVLSVASDWARDAFGARFSVQDTRYLAVPAQNRTDASVSVGGRIDIGDDTLTIGAAHVAEHEDRGQVDTIASDQPIAFQIDDVRASYTIADGRWSIVPAIEAANWTYAGTTIQGSPASQSYRDRLVVQGGATIRYELAPLRSALLVLRVAGQEYTHTPAGQASEDSTAYQVLAGIDYDDDSLWRWRLLVGGETRQFASPIYHRQNTLILEGGLRWQPSGLTTVNAAVGRETQDAAQEGVSGLVYSSARLTIDHEYMRDLVVRASIGLQRADFFGGGSQSGTTAGFGLTRVLNRHARVSVTWDQTELHGSGAANLVSGTSRGVGLVTLRLGL